MILKLFSKNEILTINSNKPFSWKSSTSFKFISFYLIFTLFLSSSFSHAEENSQPATSPVLSDPALQTPENPPSQPAPRQVKRVPKSVLNFRFLANYDYIMTNPNDLNNYDSNTNWGNTTKAQGSFYNMNGYSVGGGYLLGNGYLGLEYAFGMQELPVTAIIPTINTIQYTFDYSTIYAVYDWVFNLASNQSYELGGGVGYALTYQYHWIFKSGSTLEEVIWQANPNPIVFKARASYNYHFTENFRLRAAATYEYATNSNLLADSSHSGLIINGTSVIANNSLKAANGQSVTADISGLRLSVGLIAAF